jgi:hypothetical protein
MACRWFGPRVDQEATRESERRGPVHGAVDTPGYSLLGVFHHRLPGICIFIRGITYLIKLILTNSYCTPLVRPLVLDNHIHSAHLLCTPQHHHQPSPQPQSILPRHHLLHNSHPSPLSPLFNLPPLFNCPTSFNAHHLARRSRRSPSRIPPRLMAHLDPC